MSNAGKPSRNGDGTPPGIPEDVVWDSENPQYIYECSSYIEHSPDCDGNCESDLAAESQIKLLNESLAWARAGMDTSGINISSFDNQANIMALQKVLIEKGILTQDEVDEEFRLFKIDVMRIVRENNEEQIKEMKQRMALGLRPSSRKLLGPYGEELS